MKAISITVPVDEHCSYELLIPLSKIEALQCTKIKDGRSYLLFFNEDKLPISSNDYYKIKEQFEDIRNTDLLNKRLR